MDERLVRRCATLIDDVLPPGVHGVEMRIDALEADLFPGEPTMADASPKRRREFMAGRTCARRALSRFGVTAATLPRQPDRTVAWPHGFVGSITHTDGYCAAVVARSTEFSSLGVDAEVFSDIDEALEMQICSPSERGRLPQSSVADRSRRAMLIFSAKEAFYKWQYPLTGQWLDFHDVEIELAGETLVAHPLVALKTSPSSAPLLGRDEPGATGVFGRFAITDALVLTMFAL